MRYERKYKADSVSVPLALQAIRLHPAGFRTLYPDRTVNNIYFDTPSLSTYRENVDGNPERKKFRVRWYADQPEKIEQPRFEVKIKDNQLGDKEIYECDPFKLENLQSITERVNQGNPFNMALRPVLMNTYKRSYLSTPGQKFRITIDHGVHFFSMLTANQFTRYTIYDPDIIVELKYDESEDQQAVKEIMQFLSFRQTKSSKYVNGVNRCVY